MGDWFLFWLGGKYGFLAGLLRCRAKKEESVELERCQWSNIKNEIFLFITFILISEIINIISTF